MGCCSPTDRLHVRQDVSYLNRCEWSSRCGLRLTCSTPPRRPVRDIYKGKGVRRRYRERWVRSTRSLRVVMGTSSLSGKKICTSRCRQLVDSPDTVVMVELHEPQLRVGQTYEIDGILQDAWGGMRVGGSTFTHIYT